MKTLDIISTQNEERKQNFSFEGNNLNKKDRSGKEEEFFFF